MSRVEKGYGGEWHPTECLRLWFARGTADGGGRMTPAHWGLFDGTASFPTINMPHKSVEQGGAWRTRNDIRRLPWPTDGVEPLIRLFSCGN